MSVDCVTKLEEYFTCLGTGSVYKVLPFLDDDIRVTFIDPSRNWIGKQTAKDKFAKMYSNMPGFRVASHTVESILQQNQFCQIKCSISFATDEKEWISRLNYNIDKATLLIVEINHLE